MTITFKINQPVQNETPVPAKLKKKRRTHVEPEPYRGSGDFTLANFMYYLDLSHSAVHARTSPTCKRRRIPPPDGSANLTWLLATALEYLRKYQLNHLRESRGIAP